MTSVILLVDDEPAMANLVSMVLDGAGIDLVQASNLAEARDIIDRVGPDLILLDLALGSEDGMTLLSENRDLAERIPIVVFSIHDSRTQEAMSLGARSFLTKPFRGAELKAALRTHLANNRG